MIKQYKFDQFDSVYNSDILQRSKTFDTNSAILICNRLRK